LISLLLVLWIVVGSIQVGVPIGYFALMKRLTAKRDYHIVLQSNTQPTVSIIVPTYNEARVIEQKLSNIAQGTYPLSRLELIVIDSASSDGTASIAREFLNLNRLNGRVVEENLRTGKSAALNIGLGRATGELVCISDAECRWDKNALGNAVRYLSDPAVGSVSGVHYVPASGETMAGNVEGSYRSVYRMLRVAESKFDSTPIGEGEIQLFRRRDLDHFDTSVGGDDTCAALCMVEKGLRAINADDVVFFDPAPPAWRARFRQKIRRGQHVLQAFLKHKRLLWGKGIFSRVIFPMEFFIYVINPLLFLPLLVLTGVVMATIPIFAYLVTAVIIVTMAIPGLRTTATTYVSNNLTMVAAIIQEARGNKQLIWTKIDENRPLAQAPSQTIAAT